MKKETLALILIVVVLLAIGAWLDIKSGPPKNLTMIVRMQGPGAGAYPMQTLKPILNYAQKLKSCGGPTIDGKEFCCVSMVRGHKLVNSTCAVIK